MYIAYIYIYVNIYFCYVYIYVFIYLVIYSFIYLFILTKRSGHQHVLVISDVKEPACDGT